MCPALSSHLLGWQWPWLHSVAVDAPARMPAIGAHSHSSASWSRVGCRDGRLAGFGRGGAGDLSGRILDVDGDDGTSIDDIHPVGMLLLSEGTQSPNLLLAMVITLTGVVATPIIGTAIMKSMRQRRNLTLLVAELAATRAESARLSRGGHRRRTGTTGARDPRHPGAGVHQYRHAGAGGRAELESDIAEAKRHIELIRETARENLVEARAMVAELTPSPLEGRVVALRDCPAVRQALSRDGYRGDATCGRRRAPLGMATDVVLLRAAQEAISNIRKHAHARTVTVELSAADGRSPTHAGGQWDRLSRRPIRRIRPAWDEGPRRAGRRHDDGKPDGRRRNDRDGRGTRV